MLVVSSEVIVRLEVKLNPSTVNVFGIELKLLHDAIVVMADVPVVIIVGGGGPKFDCELAKKYIKNKTTTSS
jgi:hypothetical protein